MKLKLFSIILFIAPQIIFAQLDDSLYTNWFGGHKIEQLPDYIDVIENSIFLYADYSHIRDDSIPIYIINTSDSVFQCDGYDLAYLQQEHQNQANKWIRSRSYFFGWCGTQYDYTLKVNPGHFSILEELLLKEGEKCNVRFSLLNSQVISTNIGLGYFSHIGAETAKYDDISMKLNGSDFLISIIKNGLSNYNGREKTKIIIQRAIRNLSWYYPDIAIPILKELSNNTNSEYQEAAANNLKAIYRKRNK